jgi:cation:H+ antiporter
MLPWPCRGGWRQGTGGPRAAAVRPAPHSVKVGRGVLHSLSLPVVVLLFAASAAVVWVAGVYLSHTTDVLCDRWHLGEAMGGLILLAVTTNLPEIAIVTTAALSHNLGIAIGNILGGIAIQTVVLAVLDGVGVRGREPLTYRAASLQLVLEGVLVIAVLVVAIMGTRLPNYLIAFRVSPAALLIAVLWLVGLWLLRKAGVGLPWHEQGHAPGGQAEPPGIAIKKKSENARRRGVSTGRTVAVFALGALATLGAGVLLEQSGEAIAGRVGLSGVLFGATALAAATALPEVSSGLASVRLGDYKLAVSDIFGGNAFLPVLFLPATLLSGEAVLPKAQDTDVYLAGLGILLTTVYVCGLVFRPARRIVGLGIDSLVMLALYLLATAGLVAVARG